MSEWYEDKQAALREQQAEKTRTEIADQLERKNLHVFDPDNAPKQTHLWVDRGLKYSCEGATHPMHQVWKRPVKPM